MKNKTENLFSLKGKACLITGSARGLGRAMARRWGKSKAQAYGFHGFARSPVAIEMKRAMSGAQVSGC